MSLAADFRKFITWLFGSLAIFGCISTLVVYVMYNGGSATNCNVNDTQCIEQNQNIEANKRDNEILRIVSPTAIAVGIMVVLLMRCWEQSPVSTASFAPRVEGEGNAGYNDHESADFDSPPSYSDALQMDAVLEAHGTFPDEAPPKYDDIICYQTEPQSSNHNPVSGGSQQTIHVAPDAGEGDASGNVNEEDTTAPQTANGLEGEDSSSTAREPSAVEQVSTTAITHGELNDVQGSVLSDVEGQNPASQNIRISVLCRDNNLSPEEASNMNVHDEEPRTAQSQSNDAGPASFQQANGSRDETIHCTVTMGDNTEQRGRGQSTVVINSLCSGSQTNVEVHCSTSSAATGANPNSVAVSLNIRDSNGRTDVLEQRNRASSITFV